MNRVKGEVCYGGLGAREISNDGMREEDGKEPTGWAVPTSFVRWMSMTSGRSFSRTLELVAIS